MLLPISRKLAWEGLFHRMGHRDSPRDEAFPPQDWRAPPTSDPRGHLPLLQTVGLSLSLVQILRLWGSPRSSPITSTHCLPGKDQDLKASLPSLPDLSNRPNMIGSWPANGVLGFKSGAHLLSNQKEL